MEEINYVLGYDNLKIYQNTEMLKFSLDSVLLANFVNINPSTKKILDIGTGNAIIPLILSTKTKANITGIEIQDEVATLALKSVKINKLENQINIINDDINEYTSKSETEIYDIITCNPPFFKLNDNSILNESKYKQIARHEINLNLEKLIKVSKKLLKNNGKLAIVHRPKRLIEIIENMKQNNIEPKRICFIYPKINLESNILLIEGIKNGKPGIKILPPIYIHNLDNSYTDTVKKYFS